VFFLLLTAAITATFYLLFRWFEIYEVKLFPAVTFNYLFCALTGLVFSYQDLSAGLVDVKAWIPWSLLLGVLFIATFFLMGVAVQRVSITASTIASKMSFSIPVFINLFFYDVSYGWLNYIGLLMAFVAVILTSIKKESNPLAGEKVLWIIVAVFIGTGAVDATINVVNRAFTGEAMNKVFPLVSFFIAFFIGFTILLSQKNAFRKKDVLAGAILGVPNYFSIYSLMQTLETFDGNGAFVFPLLNIIVIVFTNILGVLLFKEKISKVNLVGIVVALAAIVLVSELWKTFLI